MASMFYTVWLCAGDVALGQPLQEGVVTISGSSTASAGLTSAAPVQLNQRLRVRIYCDTAAFVTWGASPTALTDGTAGRPVGADNPEYFDIQSGHQIACIERV